LLSQPDREQINLAAVLCAVSRRVGFALGDRSRLALARTRRARVVAADANWKRIEGFEIIAVRGD
jgi:PIN domain nuclease of toxin-antitoxin system